MKSYINFSRDLAEKAGEIMRKNFALGVKKEWKSDNSPLTETDKEINQLVLDNIEKTYPSHSVLSEEGSNKKDSEYTWVCDPLDGTIPFSHGFPTFVFAIALVQNGTSLTGVIYDPFLKRMVWAEKSKGAFLNNRKVYVSKSISLKRTLVDSEMGHDAKYNIHPLSYILMKDGCFPTTLRSTFYAGMLVSIGEFAGVIATGKNPWDAAPLKIIVEEAGGKVTNLFGEEQRYDRKINGLIASNRILHKKLLELVKPLVKKI